MMNMETRTSYKGSWSNQVNGWSYDDFKLGTPLSSSIGMSSHNQQPINFIMLVVIQRILETVVSRYRAKVCDIYNAHVDMFNQAYIGLVHEFLKCMRAELDASIKRLERNIDKLM